MLIPLKLKPKSSSSLPSVTAFSSAPSAPSLPVPGLSPSLPAASALLWTRIDSSLSYCSSGFRSSCSCLNQTKQDPRSSLYQVILCDGAITNSSQILAECNKGFLLACSTRSSLVGCISAPQCAGPMPWIGADTSQDDVGLPVLNRERTW